MKILEVIKKIELNSNCKIVKRHTDYASDLALPKDLNYFLVIMTLYKCF